MEELRIKNIIFDNGNVWFWIKTIPTPRRVTGNCKERRVSSF